MSTPSAAVKPFGLLAEFDTPEEILAAARKARDAGYKKMDAYTPYPLHEMTDALGHRHSRIAWLIFLGGLLGGTTGFLLQTWCATVAYRFNVADRPFYSWPAFIPVTFECIILGASLTAVFGMILLNGLPRPYHPLFNVDRFALASQTKFFLCIESTDPKFNATETRQFLESLGARDVQEVPE
jgi:hypothetical protein